VIVCCEACELFYWGLIVLFFWFSAMRVKSFLFILIHLEQFLSPVFIGWMHMHFFSTKRFLMISPKSVVLDIYVCIFSVHLISMFVNVEFFSFTMSFGSPAVLRTTLSNKKTKENCFLNFSRIIKKKYKILEKGQVQQHIHELTFYFRSCCLF